MYPFKVSVVTAVYNVEPFLREAVDSILAQDLGFTNIQLILVDDGSTDGSGQICDEYAAKYPDNILVIHKENGGVSSARNAGLDLVQGKYVNFMDADDKLGPSALSLCCHFLDTHYGETDVVTIPIHYFDARTGEHGLNFKFSRGTRVIDLKQEWQAPLCSVHCTVVKADCAKKLRFDLRLSMEEDTKFIQRLLLSKQTLGVVSEAIYWYRIRNTFEKSIMQDEWSSKFKYLPLLRYMHLDTLSYCQEAYGFVPKHVQYVVSNEMGWRLRQKHLPTEVLTEAEIQEYLCLIREILQYLDDDIIAAPPHMARQYRILAYRLKYGDALQTVITSNNVALRINGKDLHRTTGAPLRLEFYSNNGNTCTIEGVLHVYPGILGEQKLIAKSGNREYAACSYGSREGVTCLGQEVMQYLTFRFELPLKAGKSYHWQFFTETAGRRIAINAVWFSQFFPINDKYRKIYYASKGWILTAAQRGIYLRPQTRWKALRMEAAFCRELWHTGEKNCHNAVFMRTLAHILRRWKRKRLWLISDRATIAGDNGEAFYRYIRENHPEIDARFVINGDSPDYLRIKQLGPVLKRSGFFHKLHSLVADCVISSHAERDTFCPFVEDRPLYQDLLPEVNHIFLQHGVMQWDCSHWLSRTIKNFSGVVATAWPEYEAFHTDPYEYTNGEIWLTGLPRFDRLYHAEENWITIMPTWRKYLLGSADPHTTLYSALADIEQSSFCRYYRDLLSHPRLHEAARKYGYRLKFLPHPNMQVCLHLFQHDGVDCLDAHAEYRDVYARSRLVITDYSSAAFDFAYLRKPVVYTQFDRQEFLSGKHIARNHRFNYEQIGFGEVEYELEATVDRIIEYMENGCKLKDFYRDRIDRFFAFNDQNSCQRLYDKILELDNK